MYHEYVCLNAAEISAVCQSFAAFLSNGDVQTK